MQYNHKTIKHHAKKSMRMTRPSFWVVTLLYLALTSGVTMLFDILASSMLGKNGLYSVTMFVSIFILLYKVVIEFGYDLWSLWASRAQNPDAWSLLQGFSVSGRVIFMNLQIIGWMMLYSCGAGMVVAILLFLFSSTSLFVLLPVVSLPIIFMQIILLRFRLAPYLLADFPDQGAGAAVYRSRQLMKHHIWPLLRLELSFLGWLGIIYLIRGLVDVAFLWQGGVLAALRALPSMPLQDLAMNYFFWLNGDMLGAVELSAPVIHLFELYQSVQGSLLPALVSSLLTLPIVLIYLPLRSVSLAEFYDLRLKNQRDTAPPLHTDVDF